MDLIKEAFSRIKKDIYSIQVELATLRQEVQNIAKNQVPTTHQIVHRSETQQTNRQPHPTDTPTQNIAAEPLKIQNIPFSIGNGGVPTDKQTDKQTDKLGKNRLFHKQNTFDEAEEVRHSLDSLKEEIRRKFHSLTPQEMLVFTTIYSFQDQNRQITYKSIAQHLTLSESSIRDYTNRLILKEVPIIKEKVNNKQILLSISPSLRKNISLSTIIALRDA
ncbi:hypothetical protein CMI41_02935 [Candidatus Pacearchaeota archaeon]|nr:hypothetical protein [Candidatus Pacearchaeota archaeon]|tara:strand:+ start:6642 stop:7298 length:657 start_codon:yes stop_codon:yes gene_type:complete